MISGQLQRLAKGTFIYGLGGMLNQMFSFLLLPLFTRYLSPADYGVSAILAILATLLGTVFSLGTKNSIGICYFSAEEGPERGRVVWTTFLLMVISSVSMALIGFVFAPQISRLALGTAEYAYLIYLVLASLAANTAITPFFSFFRLEEKVYTFVILSTISTLLKLLLSIYTVVYLERGVQGLFEASLAAAIATLVLTIILTVPALKFSINLRWVAPLVKIGYPSMLGVGALFLIDWADRLMLQRLVGLEEVGVYAIGYSMGMILLLLVNAFGSAWIPYRISFLSQRAEASILFGYVLRYYFLFYGLLTLVSFLFARPIVTLMTERSFHSAYTVVGPIAASYFFKGLYLILITGVVFEKKLHLQTWSEWLAALVNIALNLLLIPLLFKDGAATATLAAYLALSIISYIFGSKYLPIQCNWGDIAKFVFGFVILAAISYYQFAENLVISFFISSLLFVIFCLYTFYVVLTNSERGRAGQLVLWFKAKLTPALSYR